jgi:hypothetical protein
MKIKLVSLVSSVSLFVSLMSFANPAKAITFAVGDILQLNSDFHNSAGNVQQVKFLDSTNTPQNIGSYGNFGIENNSTGSFTSFVTNGTISSAYKILSVDFSNLASYVNQDFLIASLPNGVTAAPGPDDFKFKITSPAVYTPVGGPTSGVINFQVAGQFISTNPNNTAQGSGFLTGSFIRNQGTFSGSLEVTSIDNGQPVPETSTVLGVGLVGAFILLNRSRFSRMSGN